LIDLKIKPTTQFDDIGSEILPQNKN